MRPIKSGFPRFGCLVGAAWGALVSAGAYGQDPGCKGVLARMDQLPMTPHHQFVSMGPSAAATAPVSESISTGLAIYVADHGVWRNSGFTATEMAKREVATRKKERCRCTQVRQESLDGEPATVYQIDTDATFGKMDSQVWVAKSTGLPLLERYVLDSGSEKSYYEVRFVYTGVEAPTGVK